MNRTFRNFITQEMKKQPRVWNEVQGFSQSYIEFPTDYPGLATLLTFVSGRGDRARALNWVTTEGMMQASRGRDMLLKEVKAKIQQMTGVVKLNTARGVQNIPPTQKVGGMHEMARRIDSVPGRDPDDDEVTVHDLFSPEAWERLPILKQVKFGDMDINQYYHEKYEPRVMVIDGGDKSGTQTRYDLTEIYDIAVNEYGLPPFKYGGFDGYIQYIEKGDWLEPHERRGMVTPNGQFGFDLQPEKEYNPETGEYEEVKDAEGFDARGNPVYNFQGGASTVDMNRAMLVIDSMRDEFVKLAKAIKNNDPLDNADPKEVEKWKQMLLAKDYIEELEATLDDPDLGRIKSAKRAGFPQYGKGKAKSPMPSHVSPEFLTELIMDGLDGVFFRSKVNAFGNPNAIGPQIDDPNNAPEEGGWYCITPKGLYYKWNPQQQKELLDYIFAEVDETGLLNTNFYLKNVPSVAAAQPDGNTKFNLSTVLSAGFKADEERLKGMKMLVYRLKGKKDGRTDSLNPKRWVSTQQSVKKEVNPHPYADDPIIQHLLQNGFQWELKTAKDREYGHPLGAFFDDDPEADLVGFLTNGRVRYRVALDVQDGKWYLHIPVDKKGDPYVPASFGKSGSALLRGSRKIRYGGGRTGGHLNLSPIGEKTWKSVLQRLMAGAKGGLGEYERNGKGGRDMKSEYGADNLPSVWYGVNQAKLYFNSQKSDDQRFAKYNQPSDHFEDSELYQWGFAALKTIANDPAFYVGWISQQEIDKFIPKNRRKKKKLLGKFEPWDLEGEKELEKAEPGKGKGLYALMLRHGYLDGDETDEEARNEVMNFIKQNIGTPLGLQIIDEIKKRSPEAALAFEDNAYEFRAKRIGQAILRQMALRIKEEGLGTLSLDGMGGDEDGESGGYDVAQGAGGRHVSMRGEYDYEKQMVNPSDLAKIAGVELPDADPPPQWKVKATTPGGSQQPRSSEPLNVAQTKSQAGLRNLAGSFLGTPQKPKIAPGLKDPESSLLGKPQRLRSPGQQSQTPSGLKDLESSFLGKPQRLRSPGQQPQTPSGLKGLEDSFFGAAQPPQQQQAPQQPQQPSKLSDLENKFFNMMKKESFLGYRLWKLQQEMTGTDAVAVAYTPRDGDGWNWWGALGRIGGTSISGEADTAKTDPTGKKGKKRGRRKK